MSPGGRGSGLLKYVLVGAYFGLVLTKGEVISWFRIQEMFRFQGFHMYGVLGTGVVIAAATLWAIRRFGLRSPDGSKIEVEDKERTPLGARYWLGGLCFGLGWGLLGACPGPIYTLIGTGTTVLVVALASALAGTWAYAALAPKLPH